MWRGCEAKRRPLVSFFKIGVLMSMFRALNGRKLGVVVSLEGIMAEYIGTSGDDRFAGTSKADTYYVGAGNNTIFSGAGDDRIFVGGGDNFINAGTGDDLIVATGFGNNVLSGGDGNDVIVGAAGNDYIVGGTGNDVMSGGAGADYFEFKAGFGNDLITDFSFEEKDTFTLAAGAVGNAKNIKVNSVADIDALVTAKLATVSTDSNGTLTLDFGSFGSIKLQGLGGSSTPGNVGGTSGSDMLIGSSVDGTHIVAAGGDDRVFDGTGSSLIEGNDGNDLLFGGNGDDRIGGQGGDDTLIGGRGNDILAGDGGNDTLIGGQGADTFIFSDKSSFGKDVITDLSFGSDGDGDSLAILFGGKPTKITSVAELNSFVKSSGAIVTADDVSTTLTFSSGDSIRLIGYGEAGGSIIAA